MDEGSSLCKEGPGVDFLSKLPSEISLYIFSLLPSASDVLHSSLVCRDWHKITSDPVLWRQLFLQQRGWNETHEQIAHLLPRLLPATCPPVSDWQKYYMGHYELDRRWMFLQTKIRGDTIPTPFRPQLSRLKGHQDSVYACCFVPSPRKAHRGYIATGSRDLSIRLWDSESNECVFVLSGHCGSVLSLHYEDGLLVSGSSDGTACVWRQIPLTMSDKPEFTLRGHEAGVLGVCMDHHWIVTASRDTTLRVWHRNTGELANIYRGHNASVNTCHINEGRIASAAADGSVHIWDPSTGETLQELTGISNGVATVFLSHDVCFTGSSDKAVRIWQWRTGQCICQFQAHHQLVRTLTYDPRKYLLVTGGWDRMTRIWHLASLLDPAQPFYNQSAPHLLLENGMHHGRIFHVSMDATRVLAACEDKSVWITDYMNPDLCAPHLYY